MLAISLAEKTRFRAGDTIIGWVTRSAHIVDSDVALSIKFLGRTKVKIVISRGQSSSTYRSRYIFWNSRNPPVSARLYNGPIHVPPNIEESQSWPFAITIPTNIPEETIYQEESDATFLKPGDPETVQLPGSYMFDDDSFWGNSSVAYVDYHLEAVLQDSKGHRFEARIPIKIDGPSSPIPITDFGVRSFRGNLQFLNTHRLNPALADAKLSFGQKAQQVFGSSKVPILAFQITANTPSVLQLDNPNFIPFQVQGSVMKDRTSEVLRDLHPTLVITRFLLRLTANCKVIAPGTFSSHDENGETTWTIIEYLHRGTTRGASSPSPSPSPSEGNVQEDTNVKGEPKAAKVAREEQATAEPPPDADTLILPMDSAPFPLDLGQALQLRLPRVLRQRLVTPSFNTFNIHNSHTLSWELRVEAAGKDTTFYGKHSVNVMPPSEETLPLYNADAEPQPYRSNAGQYIRGAGRDGGGHSAAHIAPGA